MGGVKWRTGNRMNLEDRRFDPPAVPEIADAVDGGRRTVMTLRQKQSLFAELVAVLLTEAERLGFEVTLGEAWRSPEEAARLAKLGKGIKRSLHCDRLALDLNLFKDGKYLSKTEDYRLVGEAWEALNPLCRWGGRFGDGNHFSLEHGGRK